MIKDNIKNIENYFDLSDRVKLGLKYLIDTNLTAIKNEENKEKDIIFLKHNQEGSSDFINLKTNEFAIFTPKDAHMPSITTKAHRHVKKAVVKVAI